MKVTLSDDGAVLKVEGNTCPRGVGYANSECTHPVRTVTSTAVCSGGEIISVKTESPIPKELIFRVMEQINKARPNSNIKIGDVVVSDVAATGVNVVATSNAQ